MDELDILQADIMRTLAQPRRLQIIHRLVGGPVEVSRIALDLGISQPNASQHLAVMRNAGVVEAERSGREVRYRLTDPEIVAACTVMRGVLGRRLERLAGLSDMARRPVPTNDPEHPLAAEPEDTRPTPAEPTPSAGSAATADRPLATASPTR